MTTSSTVMCESNTFNLGPWCLGWAHQRESPPPNPSILWWSCCFFSAKCHSDFPAICKLLSPKPSISSVIHDQHSSVCIIPCLLFCLMIQGLKVIWVLCAGKTGIVSEFCWMQEIIDLNQSLQRSYYKDSIFIDEYSVLYAGFPLGQDNTWNQRAWM
jgi:hypothetical protein